MARNAWSDPSRVSPDDAARMAAFLESRAALPDQAQINRQVVAALTPRPGQRLLEIGCGSGALARLLAGRVRPGGAVLGLDIAACFLVEAERLVRRAGLSDTILLQAGTAEALPYADASLDGVVAARLLLHAADPDAAVGEMARVVRPGGRVVVMDWDFETVAVDHPERELTRRLLAWRTDHHGGDNWCGRQGYRRLQASGLRQVQVRPVVTVAHDENNALTQSLWRAAEVARDGGAITPAEHDRWVAALRQALAQNCFFASIVHFVVRGVKGP